MIVRVQHLRLVKGYSKRGGYCSRGARAWFAAHGLDWAAFVRNGIDADVLRATRDPFALKLLDTLDSMEAGTDGQ